MLGGMNPAQLKQLMKQMGIKNTEIEATKVTIEKTDGGKLVLENPNVLMIEMGGQKSLQVTGEIKELEGSGEKSKEKSDVELVMEGAPGATRAQAEKALKETGGDIAEAIMKLAK